MKRILNSLTTDNVMVSFFLLLTLFISLIMISPKWNIGIFSFLAYTANLRYFRNVKMWKATLLTLFVYCSASFIANQGVMPFPGPLMLTFILINGTIQLIPFLLDKIMYKRLPPEVSVFVFPAAAIVVDSFIAHGPKGTFGNIAYTMVDFNILMQLVSVTGIWGVAFLIYLFASVVNQILENKTNISCVIRYSVIYISLFSFIVLFGFFRLQSGKSSLDNAETVTLASVTSENVQWLIAVNKAVTGETIVFPKKLDQTSPEIIGFQSSFNEFILDHNNPRYDSVYIALDNFYDEIFEFSQKAADAGAKGILLSESEIITFEDREKHIIERAKTFAKKNEVYYFLAMTTIFPERMVAKMAYSGNKILSINPSGEIIDIYYKNVPVIEVDPSIPGDGKIDIIETPYGNFSPVICYDADFPDLMKQTGNNGTDIILAATGDWYSITPYHSRIGVIRSIENGVSMLKTASYGLSLAADPYGNILAEDDFFTDENHIMIAEVPVKRVKTLYSTVGDIMILLPQIYLLVMIVYLLSSAIIKKMRKYKT